MQSHQQLRSSRLGDEVQSLKNSGDICEEDNEQQYAPMEIDSQNINLSEDNEQEILRLIEQYLTNHGYEEIANNLQEKSNVRMEDNVVNDFRENVLAGHYTNLKEQINRMSISQEQARQIEYYLYEQYYLELMERNQKLQAIQVLQRELAPRTLDKERLHQLAQLIMCSTETSCNTNNGFKTASELRRQANWKGSDTEGRKELLDKIQTLMPSSSMLQPNRLEHLIKQALAFQVHNCKFHNVYSSQYSLLEDHICSKQMIPTKCIAVLKKHKDEVWQVKFSPSGKKLASMGKDNILYLWSLVQTYDNQKLLKASNSNPQQNKYRVKCTHEIKGHQKQINSLNWTNTDDRWLITASHDFTAKVWDSKTGKIVLELTKHQEAIQSAVFTQDDSRIITVAVDKQIILWEIKSDDNNGFYAMDITKVETRNFLDLALSGNRFVTMGQSHIQVFNLASEDSIQDSMEDIDSQFELELSDTLTSINLSKDGRYLLANVSLKSPKLELYDLNRREVIHRYRGHKQEMYIIRCAFGGVNESFVLCGSEDASIYIWNKEKGDLIARLDGHTQVINAVHWNPQDPFIFASASDDQTIRIWGIEDMPTADVIIDNKEIKRVDQLHQNSMNGNKYNGLDEEDEDDEEDMESEDDEEVGEDYRNQTSEDEEDWAEGNH